MPSLAERNIWWYKDLQVQHAAKGRFDRGRGVKQNDTKAAHAVVRKLGSQIFLDTLCLS